MFVDQLDTLISIIEHARAWLAEDRKKLGVKASDNPELLIQARAAYEHS